MIPLLETLVHKIPLILCFPSICLAAFGIYIIQVKSTSGMKNYKKILIAIALVTLNFDIGLSVVIGPKPLPGAVGSENNGFVALLWPSGGKIQILYVLLGFVAQFEICVIGFSYRERTILHNQHSPWHKFYGSFQILVYILVGVAVTMAYMNGVLGEEQARQYMNQTGRLYCRECSICVVADISTLITGGLVALLSVSILNIFIAISIYRIRRYLATEKGHLSHNTIKMQQMLLTSLIWQYMIPFLLVSTPIVIMAVVVFIIPVITNNYKPQPVQEDMTAICMLMPAFFSIGHSFCTIYFTAPYKKYVKDLLTGRRETVTASCIPTQMSTTRTLL